MALRASRHSSKSNIITNEPSRRAARQHTSGAIQAIVAQSVEHQLPKLGVAESCSVYRSYSPIKTNTTMTEITAISRMTGKISYHATFPRKITEAQIKQDLQGMQVTDEKHIILISYPDK